MDSLSVHFWFKIALFCILGHVQVLSQKNVGNLDFLTKMSYNIDQRSIIKKFLLQLSDMPKYINLNIYDNILIRDLRYPKSLVMTTQKVFRVLASGDVSSSSALWFSNQSIETKWENVWEQSLFWCDTIAAAVVGAVGCWVTTAT